MKNATVSNGSSLFDKTSFVYALRMYPKLFGLEKPIHLYAFYYQIDIKAGQSAVNEFYRDTEGYFRQKT